MRILMFDLASHITGWCLYDVAAGSPIAHGVITIDRGGDNPDYDLKEALRKTMASFHDGDLLVSTEAMPTQLHSGASTIKVFIAMAQAHADLAIACAEAGLPMYDRVGVYPASTHAYLRRLLGKDMSFKPSKDDIRFYCCDLWHLNIESVSYDESDAMFLAKTLVDVKWDKDIDERIKDLKRHRKGLKEPSAIAKIDKEIAEAASHRLHKED
ncbi:MAG: hypothetical protein ABFC95_02440 [Smithella sp.]